MASELLLLRPEEEGNKFSQHRRERQSLSSFAVATCQLRTGGGSFQDDTHDSQNRRALLALRVIIIIIGIICIINSYIYMFRTTNASSRTTWWRRVLFFSVLFETKLIHRSPLVERKHGVKGVTRRHVPDEGEASIKCKKIGGQGFAVGRSSNQCPALLPHDTLYLKPVPLPPHGGEETRYFIRRVVFPPSTSRLTSQSTSLTAPHSLFEHHYTPRRGIQQSLPR